MEEENKESIEQITKTPLPTKTDKIKDPKKIAAGKKLAEYNKKAKEALLKHEREEKLKKIEKIDEDDEEEENGDYSFLPATSFTTIIALLGLGLTTIYIFLRYKQQYKSSASETGSAQQKPKTNFISNISETKISAPEEKHSGQFGME